MKTIVTLLLILGVTFSPTLRATATEYEHHGDHFTFAANSDCKGDKDDDCR
ncbi:hypothetical protein [Aphanothece hegewaldii]|uniref:hypothetical protein n=1 Tax=Aphanothece hegewaldii TaxID=1521625 RepID=UPI0015E731B2|nr:hypothetical protein [Aphanothece hegewaldii]